LSKRRGRRPVPHRERGGPRRERPHRERFVVRTFQGLATETEWVALRELVPAATARVRFADPALADRPLVVTTVLPMAYPALVKPDGRIFLGVQAQARSGDLSRDLAAVVERALATRPGRYVTNTELAAPGARLQDLLADGGRLEVTLHDSFRYWLDLDESQDPDVAASLERANAAILPTVRLPAAPSAYWCQVPEKAHLRWVLGEDEDVALDALARLHAAGAIGVGSGSRYAGAFRAHGLLVPVWDLPREADPMSWDDGLAALTVRYSAAVRASEPLSAPERRARDGLRGRQLTLR